MRFIGGICKLYSQFLPDLIPRRQLVCSTFCIDGQYMVTLLFTAMSPVMSVADRCKRKVIQRYRSLNYLAMGALGLYLQCMVSLVLSAKRSWDTFG